MRIAWPIGVRAYFDSIHLKKKIRPVNRIDKDTSGLVIFAKNEYIQECLIQQMQKNIFVKEYLALTYGHFKEKKGIICAPIARKENSIIERCVLDSGDASITHYEVLEELYLETTPISFVKCILETGRTHQIRVHMAYIGHPLVGDSLYNEKKTQLLKRQALHSYKVSFLHPISKEKMEFIAPPPQDIFTKNTEKR